MDVVDPFDKQPFNWLNLRLWHGRGGDDGHELAHEFTFGAQVGGPLGEGGSRFCRIRWG